jgi:hypothetical protein
MGEKYDPSKVSVAFGNTEIADPASAEFVCDHIPDRFCGCCGQRLFRLSIRLKPENFSAEMKSLFPSNRSIITTRFCLSCETGVEW